MLRQSILEIKNRIILIFLLWFLTFLTGYQYREILLSQIIQSGALIDYFIITDVTEAFLTYIKLNQFLSNYFLISCSFYHAFLFIEPGLYHFERTFLKNLIQTYIIILIFGIIFWYFTGISLLWSFFLEFQQKISEKIVHTYFETKLNQFLCFYLHFWSLLVLIVSFFTIL
jgi:Sec-independent protein secretion pathway component TatC